MAGTDREIDPAEFEPDPYFDEDTADEIHRYHFASDGECDIILVPDYIERGGHYRGYTLEWSELFVSSKVMSAHSPVFRAMFNGPWKESQKVSLDAPGICRLPKDPDKALRQLCYVMHWPDTPIDPFMDIMDLELMREFVILCDKYDCVKIAKNWVQTWLLDQIAHPSKTEDFYKFEFIWITYAMDLWDLFPYVSESIMLHVSSERNTPFLEPWSLNMSRGGWNIIPEKIRGTRPWRSPL